LIYFFNLVGSFSVDFKKNKAKVLLNGKEGEKMGKKKPPQVTRRKGDVPEERSLYFGDPRLKSTLETYHLVLEGQWGGQKGPESKIEGALPKLREKKSSRGVTSKSKLKPVLKLKKNLEGPFTAEKCGIF